MFRRISDFCGGSGVAFISCIERTGPWPIFCGVSGPISFYFLEICLDAVQIFAGALGWLLFCVLKGQGPGQFSAVVLVRLCLIFWNMFRRSSNFCGGSGVAFYFVY